MTMPLQNNNRYNDIQHNDTRYNYTRHHYLDAVRAFALILGIVFHASLSFMPIFIGWAVMDVSTSHVVSVFVLVSHSFRMELFFLIAGFFSHMKFYSDGIQAFVKSRLIRILVPFVIAWFLLRPLIVSAWIAGAESMQGDANILKALATGFATLGDLPKDLFVGTHLWFLYYLLLITFSALLLRYLIGLNQALEHKLVQLADTTTHWICSSRFAIFAVSIPTSVCLWFMSHWGMDTPDKTLTPQTPVLFVYGGFFVFGWLLHRQAPLIEQFSRLSWSKFALCLFTIVMTTLLSGFEAQPGHAHHKLLKGCFTLSYAVMMWTLVSLVIGLFKRWLDRPSKTIRYIADSSYWLYLIHLPIVIWLQVAVAEFPIHWSIKMVSISALTVLGSLLLYDILVRSTFIEATLNGRGKPRLLFSSNK